MSLCSISYFLRQGLPSNPVLTDSAELWLAKPQSSMSCFHFPIIRNTGVGRELQARATFSRQCPWNNLQGKKVL